MTTLRRHGAQIVAVLGVTGAATTGCAHPPASSPPTTTTSISAPVRAELVLSFDDSTVPGEAITALEAGGTGASSVRVSARDGGRVVSVAGADGPAARFPVVAVGAAAGSAHPMAAVVLLPAGAVDVLSPGTRDFVFGADVELDATSEGPLDNGDNVLQRGLYEDAAQLKLQLDHGSPACRVAGVGGVAEVEADLMLDRDRWYRLTCSRFGSLLHLDVRAWSGGSWAPPSRWSVAAVTGTVSFDPGVPLSVGAKVGPDGRIPESSGDPFSGSLDNAVLDVLDALGGS